MDLVLKLSAFETYEDFLNATGITKAAEDTIMGTYMRVSGLPESEWNDTMICQ